MFTAGRFFLLPDAFLSTDGWKIFTEPGQKYLCIGLLLGDYQLAQAYVGTTCGTILLFLYSPSHKNNRPLEFSREQNTTDDDTTKRDSSILFGNNEHGF